MKKILIALDYDSMSEKVAELGFSLAKAMAAEVVLIHVIADIVYYSSTAYSPIMGFGGYIDTGLLETNTVDTMIKASQHFLDRSKKHLGDKAIQTEVMQGDVADSIIAAAKDLEADIIVIGSHSHKWLESVIMGSVSEKVLQHTSIPLFIIPTKKQD
jgi:nucleotide-binding universal stress UspA family protein